MQFFNYFLVDQRLFVELTFEKWKIVIKTSSISDCICQISNFNAYLLMDIYLSVGSLLIYGHHWRLWLLRLAYSDNNNTETNRLSHVAHCKPVLLLYSRNLRDFPTPISTVGCASFTWIRKR